MVTWDFHQQPRIRRSGQNNETNADRNLIPKWLHVGPRNPFIFIIKWLWGVTASLRMFLESNLHQNCLSLRQCVDWRWHFMLWNTRLLNILKWKFIAVCVSSFQTQTHTFTISPCLLTADNAAQCSGKSRLLFQVPSENLSPSSPPAVCRWWVVMCCKLGEGLLFSLKPQALFGNWLVCVCVCVCVCVVHNGCVYIGFGVHMFIHACTFIRTCRLCFLLSRERGVGFLSLGIPNRYQFTKSLLGVKHRSQHPVNFVISHFVSYLFTFLSLLQLWIWMWVFSCNLC